MAYGVGSTGQLPNDVKALYGLTNKESIDLETLLEEEVENERGL